MNSLEELNNFGAVSINFTDNRTPALVFDRPASLDQTVTIERGDTHSVPVATNIIEFVNAPTVTYTVDVSAVVGATLTWAAPPAGVTVTNLSSGIYTVTGMDSVTDWTTMRSPTVNLPSTYVGEFNYTVSINYGSDSRIYTVSVAVAQTNIFASTVSAYYFDESSTALLPAPEILTNKAGTYTITITPSVTNRITTMAASISDPTGITSFNGTTKVYTITGTIAEVKTYLAAVNVTYSATPGDFTWTYSATTDSVFVDSDSVTQAAIYNLEILTEATGTGNYTPNILTTVTNTPQIDNLAADPGSDPSLNYTLTVTPSNSDLIDGLSIPNWNEYISNTAYTVNPANAPDGGVNTVWNISISSSGDRMAVHSGDDNVSVDATYLYEYVKSGTTWTLNQTLSDTIEDFSTNIVIKYSYDETVLAVGDVSYGNDLGRITIYTRSGNTWTVNSEITGADQYDSLGEALDLNIDGTRMAYTEQLDTPGAGNENRVVKIVTRSGSTWTLAQTIAGSTTEYFGNRIAMTPDGTRLVITSLFNYSSPNYTGRAYVYLWNGSSYVLEQTLEGASSTSRFGSSIDLNATGDKLWISSPGHNTNVGKLELYTRSGTTWTLSKTINNPTSTTYIRLGQGSAQVTSSSTGAYNNIQTSSDGNFIAAGADDGTNYIVHVFKLYDGNWQYHNSVRTERQTVWQFDPIDFSHVVIRKVGEADNKFYADDATVSTGAFNGLTKVLTLSGNKLKVNSQLQQLQVLAKTTTAEDFELTYAVTTPASATDSRPQTIRNTQ